MPVCADRWTRTLMQRTVAYSNSTAALLRHSAGHSQKCRTVPPSHSNGAGDAQNTATAPTVRLTESQCPRMHSMICCHEGVTNVQYGTVTWHARIVMTSIKTRCCVLLIPHAAPHQTAPTAPRLQGLAMSVCHTAHESFCQLTKFKVGSKSRMRLLFNQEPTGITVGWHPRLLQRCDRKGGHRHRAGRSPRPVLCRRCRKSWLADASQGQQRAGRPTV
jgi:hypothetical protein